MLKAAGCSGAWVVADNKLCGHIVAIREGLPIAYMLSAATMFKEISSCFGGIEVRLPRAQDCVTVPAHLDIRNVTGFIEQVLASVTLGGTSSAISRHELE